jgi:hypothetical protein
MVEFVQRRSPSRDELAATDDELWELEDPVVRTEVWRGLLLALALSLLIWLVVAFAAVELVAAR